MRILSCFIAGLALAGAASAQGKYATKPGETCGGFPRIAIETQPGMCAGLVVQSPGGRGNMRLPRDLIPVPGTSDWLITDLGGWNVTAGAVFRLSARPGEAPKITRLLVGLEMPHTIAIGPDKRVYVGEMGRIFAFDPNAANPKATIANVVTGLPDNRLHDNRHPLSAFMFAPDGALLVNVGAASDQCLDKSGKPLGKRCPEGEGKAAQAVVRRYAPAGPGKWSSDYTVFASGLRNSMALVATPNGKILQIENSIDIADEAHPFDEINVLVEGRHYGWPYCVDRDASAPGWKGEAAMDCAGPGHARPAALLGPHSAPLGMTYYAGAMFPDLKGRLLVGLHGYKPAGARIVSFAVDAEGVPAGEARDMTPGWTEKKGVRPRGSPVGIAVAADGSIWVADDRSRAIIRFARDGG